MGERANRGDELVGGERVAKRGPAAVLKLAGDAQGARDAEAALAEAALVVAREDLAGGADGDEARLVERDYALRACRILH